MSAKSKIDRHADLLRTTVSIECENKVGVCKKLSNNSCYCHRPGRIFAILTDVLKCMYVCIYVCNSFCIYAVHNRNFLGFIASNL